MSDERCPHCGSDDYGRIGGDGASDMPEVCLTCGYDTENGTAGVCLGGKHPANVGDLCCDACWKRMPIDLPGYPRWRSRLRRARVYTTRGSYNVRAWDDAEGIHAAIKTWLADHQRDSATASR